ncbi:TetR family transcriptional regulator [Allohahella sp. A8]|uniref:TetR family transcriptional regulator n=1 Tax=Allohahella sp. A8 TaxID=3141461 RepID=UPI000C0AAE04|nr:TetR family transcriptional regulator [Hahellaceae bacterium]
MSAQPRRSRAIDIEDKVKRRSDIERAAAELLKQDIDALPSVSDIAKAAGLAKGTLYLYFETKEAIYFSILARHYCTLLASLDSFFRNDRQSANPIDEAVGLIADFVRLNPDFMPLACQSAAVLERKVDEEVIVEFKSRLLTDMGQVSEAICRRIAGLTGADCVQLLIQTHAMLLGLWQMQHLPAEVNCILRSRGLAALIPDFDSGIRQALRQLWQGALLVRAG